MTGILRKEGFVSLYKGILPPLMSLSILNTIIFPTYACFREVYKAERGWDYRNALAGGTAGPIAGVVSTVEHMLKVNACCMMYFFLDKSFFLKENSRDFRHKCN